MIKVIIYENSQGKPIGFKLKGHAGYDVYGKDIVCQEKFGFMLPEGRQFYF